jgi:hypothetical protein
MKINLPVSVVAEFDQLKEGSELTIYNLIKKAISGVDDFLPSDEFEKNRLLALKKLVIEGKAKGFDYCRYHYINPYRSPLIYKPDVDKEPFLYRFHVPKNKFQLLEKVPGHVAYKAFDIKEENKGLIHNLNFERTITIQGVEVNLIGGLDGIDLLKGLLIETTENEPNFLEIWKRVDWKMKGLMLPELDSIQLEIFHFWGDNMKGGQRFTYNVPTDQTSKIDALEAIQNFLGWIKQRPELFKKLQA